MNELQCAVLCGAVTARRGQHWRVLVPSGEASVVCPGLSSGGLGERSILAILLMVHLSTSWAHSEYTGEWGSRKLVQAPFLRVS